jgi:hypothetical protein
MGIGAMIHVLNIINGGSGIQKLTGGDTQPHTHSMAIA